MTRPVIPELRNKAIRLRKLGLSYSEIRKSIPVSKSTLSGLLRNIKLSKKAKSIIGSKTGGGQRLGAEARHNQRVRREEEIKNSASSQIGKITDRELFLMGIMLYWGEGTKAREGNISQSVDFSNSDPKMCQFYMNWLESSLKIPTDMIAPRIYIHESKKDNEKEILKYWSNQIGMSEKKFSKTCFTRTVYPRKNKRKDAPEYHGQLRIRIKKSTDLNRKIAGWIEGIGDASGVASKNGL
jgi:hypothetical protein